MKLNLKFAAAVFLTASMAVPALAQGPGASDYSAKCAMCHGADGTSNTPAGQAMKAKSLKDPSVVKASDAALATFIKNGKSPMPAFGSQLSAAQIRAVVAYIRVLQKK